MKKLFMLWSPNFDLQGASLVILGIKSYNNSVASVKIIANEYFAIGIITFATLCVL